MWFEVLVPDASASEGGVDCERNGRKEKRERAVHRDWERHFGVICTLNVLKLVSDTLR